MDNSKKTLVITNYDLSKKTYDLSSRKELSFEEIGYSTIEGGFAGHYGMLVTDEETTVYKKAIYYNVLSSILTCSVVSSIYFAHLLKRCSATYDELGEFQDGMRKAYSDITNNNERVFDDYRVEQNMGLFSSYVQTYLGEWGKEDDGTLNMLDGGTKASDLIVTMLFKGYHLDNELSEIEIITERVKTGLEVTVFSSSLLEVISHMIKRNI